MKLSDVDDVVPPTVNQASREITQPVVGAADDAPAGDVLLRSYVEMHCEDAFAQVVNRHAKWVYQVCRRRLGNAHDADDAAQAVFILLARKAAALNPHVCLESWLFQTCRFVLADFQKRRGRYQRHLRVFHTQHISRGAEPSGFTPAPDLEMLAALDNALASLRDNDRQVVLMRFYEDLTIRQIATRLGITEEATKKRATRAVARLRSLFNGHGMYGAAVFPGVLSALIRSNTAPIPAGLTVPASSSALARVVVGGAAPASVPAPSAWVAACLAVVVSVTALIPGGHPSAGVNARKQPVPRVAAPRGATSLRMHNHEPGPLASANRPLGIGGSRRPVSRGPSRSAPAVIDLLAVTEPPADNGGVTSFTRDARQTVTEAARFRLPVPAILQAAAGSGGSTAGGVPTPSATISGGPAILPTAATTAAVPQAWSGSNDCGAGRGSHDGDARHPDIHGAARPAMGRASSSTTDQRRGGRGSSAMAHASTPASAVPASPPSEAVGELQRRLAYLIEGPGAAYLELTAGGVDATGHGKRKHTLAASLFADDEDRQDFIEFYKEVRALWEVLSPSPDLHDYVEPYHRLTKLYRSMIISDP